MSVAAYSSQKVAAPPVPRPYVSVHGAGNPKPAACWQCGESSYACSGAVSVGLSSFGAALLMTFRQNTLSGGTHASFPFWSRMHSLAPAQM
jgi:hypothetical protein